MDGDDPDETGREILRLKYERFCPTGRSPGRAASGWGWSRGLKLHCGDVVTGCAAVVEGKDEAEVLGRAAEHARKDHGVKEITPELAAKVKAAIRTE
jgi:predicted small metal-binding protein